MPCRINPRYVVVQHPFQGNERTWGVQDLSETDYIRFAPYSSFVSGRTQAIRDAGRLNEGHSTNLYWEVLPCPV